MIKAGCVYIGLVVFVVLLFVGCVVVVMLGFFIECGIYFGLLRPIIASYEATGANLARQELLAFCSCVKNDIIWQLKDESLQLCFNDKSVQVNCHILSMRSSHIQNQSQPVLFIHGANSGLLVYHKLFQLLVNNGHAVYAISLPGFGLSSANLLGNLSSADLVLFYNAYFVAVLDKVILENSLPIVVGHSFGGFLATSLFVANPDKIHSLILINSVGMFPTLDDVGLYWGIVFKTGFPNCVAKWTGRYGNYCMMHLFGITDAVSQWNVLQMTCRDNIGEVIVSRFITFHLFSTFWNRATFPELVRLPLHQITKIHFIWGYDDTIIPVHNAKVVIDSLSNTGHRPPLYLVPGWHTPINHRDGKHFQNMFMHVIDNIRSSKATDANFLVATNTNTATIEQALKQFGVSTFCSTETEANIERMYAHIRESNSGSISVDSIYVACDDRCVINASDVVEAGPNRYFEFNRGLKNKLSKFL